MIWNLEQGPGIVKISVINMFFQVGNRKDFKSSIAIAFRTLGLEEKDSFDVYESGLLVFLSLTGKL